MHSQKSSKTTATTATRAMATALLDRGLEESLLLERWAASDRLRSLDVDECDETLDQFDTASFAAHPHVNFDA